ncbi:hypothetical protein Glove_121g82 [Diversispora epigaea]|uniref:F-box domain-containing protein n=1 Tax=Diversispora epigaea TaxID=1348612 RepID=A0A397J8J5_9GLOM|nr:hypothetical protein Glove_121g82 [Diversispora epigaea]
MAGSLPNLCLSTIFEHLENDLKTLSSCIRVNRHWCLSSICELWRNPFDDFCDKDQHVKLINTYLRCLPENVKVTLGINHLSKPAFDYPYFLHVLVSNSINLGVKKWITTYNSELSNLERKKFRLNIVQVLIQHFLKYSVNIKEINLEYKQLVNIFNFPGSSLPLSKIKKLNCGCIAGKFGFTMTDILSSAIPVTKDLYELEMRLSTRDHSSVVKLAELIKIQRNLKIISLILAENVENGFDLLWESILFHKHTLVKIVVSSIKFDKKNPIPLQQFGLFQNLKELEIEYCSNFTFSIKAIDQQSSFKKLEKISMLRSSDIPEDFINVILLQSNKSMREIKLRDFECLEEVIKTCTTFCTNIISLTISINKEQFTMLIGLIKACQDLRHIFLIDNKVFTFIDEFAYVPFSFLDVQRSLLMPTFLNFNENLQELGKVIPKSLNIFRFHFNWEFSSEALDEFLCHFVTSKLKYLDFETSKFFTDDHIKVILKHCGEGTLDRLDIYDQNEISDECLIEARKKIGRVDLANSKIMPESKFAIVREIVLSSLYDSEEANAYSDEDDFIDDDESDESEMDFDDDDDDSSEDDIFDIFEEFFSDEDYFSDDYEEYSNSSEEEI